MVDAVKPECGEVQDSFPSSWVDAVGRVVCILWSRDTCLAFAGQTPKIWRHAESVDLQNPFLGGRVQCAVRNTDPDNGCGDVLLVVAAARHSNRPWRLHFLCERVDHVFGFPNGSGRGG
jgi:hypothetical protein